MVLIGISMLQNIQKEKKEDLEDENILDLIERTTQAISPIIVPMIDSLGSIEMENIIAMPEEVM